MRRTIIRRLVLSAYNTIDSISGYLDRINRRLNAAIIQVPLFSKAIAIKNASVDLIKDKSDALTQNLQITQDKTRKFANRIYYSSWLRRKLYYFFIQSWEGFFHPLAPDNLQAMVESKGTRSVLYKSAMLNLVSYLGVIYLYETLRSNARLYADTEDSYLETSLDIGMVLWLSRKASQNFIANILYNASVSKAGGKENPSDYLVGSANDISLLRASIASSFYYLVNVEIIKVAESYLPGGIYCGVFLRSLAYGQCFLEFKLANSRQDTTERYHILLANNGYCAGLGFSFMSILYLSKQLVRSLLGGRFNPFVEDALFSFLFQVYITLALIINKPLPGKQIGFNFFKLNRIIAEFCMQETSDLVTDQLGVNYINEVDNLESVKTYPPFQLVKSVLLGKDYETLESFVKLESTSTFLDYYLKDIEVAIDGLDEIRRTKWKKWIAQKVLMNAPDMMVSPEDKKTYEIAFHENLSRVIHDVKKIILRIKNIVVGVKLKDPNYQHTLNENYVRPGTPTKEVEVVEMPFDEILAETMRDKQKVIVTDLLSNRDDVVDPPAAANIAGTHLSFLQDFKSNTVVAEKPLPNESQSREHAPFKLSTTRRYISN